MKHGNLEYQLNMALNLAVLWHFWLEGHPGCNDLLLRMTSLKMKEKV